MLKHSTRIEQERQKACPQKEQDPFPVIVSERCDALALFQLSLPENEAKAKRQIISAYTESVRQIKELHNDLIVLLDAVIVAFVWMGSSKEHFRAKLSEERKAFVQLSLDVVDSLFAEVMVHDADQVAAILRDALKEDGRGAFSRLQQRTSASSEQEGRREEPLALERRLHLRLLQDQTAGESNRRFRSFFQ